MTTLNTLQIATHGLGDANSTDIWKVAFPEINFYELFPLADVVKLIQPDSVEFTEDVGLITIKLQSQLISVRDEQGGGGGGGSTTTRKRRDDQDDYQWRNITRVRCFSIRSQEHVNSASIQEVALTHSIASAFKLGSPTVQMGVGDDEDIIIMMLLAA
jgi:hypothetical protein